MNRIKFLWGSWTKENRQACSEVKQKRTLYWHKTWLHERHCIANDSSLVHMPLSTVSNGKVLKLS
jgi:hypothetical protein